MGYGRKIGEKKETDKKTNMQGTNYLDARLCLYEGTNCIVT